MRVPIAFKGWPKSFSFKSYSSHIFFKVNFVHIPTRIHSDFFLSSFIFHFHSKPFHARSVSNLISFKLPPEFIQTAFNFSFEFHSKVVEYHFHSKIIPARFLSKLTSLIPSSFFVNVRFIFTQRFTQIICI